MAFIFNIVKVNNNVAKLQYYLITNCLFIKKILFELAGSFGIEKDNL